LIHVHYASSFGSWIVGLTERPNVVSVWGSDIVAFPSNVIKKALLGRVFHYAAAITATSRYLHDQTLGKFPATADRLRVIPFGVQPCQNPPDLPSGDELRICVLKSHRRIYGQDVMLKAAARLRDRGVKFQLSLPGGPGPDTRYYHELCKRLRLTEHVTFGGWLKPDELYSFIGKHHLIALPSRSEGFGVAALEASACARPVIASQVGGLPEVVQDGETGILVDPADDAVLTEAIAALAQDRDRLKRMGEAGRELVHSRYLWQQSLDEMEALYEKVLGR
jgi:glycosyltransferase involved in cell wall biosynthesis